MLNSITKLENILRPITKSPVLDIPQKKENNQFLKTGLIPLGYRKRNGYKHIVGIEYDGKPITILISGGVKGAGKSGVGHLIYDSLRKDFNMNGLLLDPKGEMYCSIRPTQNPYYFKKRNLKPFGHKNLVRIMPLYYVYLNKMYSYGEEVQNNRNAFVQMFNTNELSEEDLRTIMNLSPAASSVLRNIIATYNENKKQEAFNLTEWMKNKKIILPDINELHSLIKNKNKYSQNKTILLREFENIKNIYAIGKTEELPKTFPKYITPDIIKLLNEKKTIDYIVGLDSTKDYLMSGYIGILIRKIRDARMSYLSAKESGTEIKDNMLKEKIFFYFEEFNTIFPKKILSRETKQMPASKPIIEQLYDQLRYLDMSIIGISPNLRDLDKTAIQQSTHLIVARTNLKEEFELLKSSRHLTEQQIEDVKTLAFNSNKTPRAEFGLISLGSKRVKRFFPMIPRSQMRME